MIELGLLTSSPFLFLWFSVLFSLVFGKKLWSQVFLALSLVMALVSQQLMWPGFLFFILAPVSLFLWINHYFAEVLRKLGFLLFLLCSFFMLTHYIDGVPSLKVFDQLVFSVGSAPFDLYLNYDKVYLAVILFNMLPPLERQAPFKQSGFTILKYYSLAILLLLPLAWLTGYVRWQPNTNIYLGVWALNNLFFVVFAEEVFFRRFIQNGLLHYLRNAQYGDVLAVMLAALLFGLAHWSGGFLYVGLATVAGVIYGFCFYQTSNVRASLAVHFGLNLTHALFFTYPFWLN
jgi:uncharacterized protein